MSDEPPEINPLALPGDWGYQIGLRFLAGAQSCGFECENAWVTSRIDPPVCCDPCQLSVFVVEDLDAVPRPGCGFLAVAHVMVMVDLCYPELDSSTPGWREADMETANDNAIARGSILSGIRRMLTLADTDFQASLTDPIRLTCRNVRMDDQWSIVTREGACERWATTFTVEIR